MSQPGFCRVKPSQQELLSTHVCKCPHLVSLPNKTQLADLYTSINTLRCRSLSVCVSVLSALGICGVLVLEPWQLLRSSDVNFHAASTHPHTSFNPSLVVLWCPMQCKCQVPGSVYKIMARRRWYLFSTYAASFSNIFYM